MNALASLTLTSVICLRKNLSECCIFQALRALSDVLKHLSEAVSNPYCGDQQEVLTSRQVAEPDGKIMYL